MKNMKTNSPLSANEKKMTNHSARKTAVKTMQGKACQDQILLPPLDMHRRKALTATMRVMNDNRRHGLT